MAQSETPLQIQRDREICQIHACFLPKKSSGFCLDYLHPSPQCKNYKRTSPWESPFPILEITHVTALKLVEKNHSGILVQGYAEVPGGWGHSLWIFPSCKTSSIPSPAPLSPSTSWTLCSGLFSLVIVPTSTLWAIVQYLYPTTLPFTCRISRWQWLSRDTRRAASGIFLWVDQEYRYDPSKDGKSLLNNFQ